jgi:hypothetical protein
MPITKKYACYSLSLSNLPGETWKDLPIFEDFYQVSSHGRVKSLPRLREIVHVRSGTIVTYWTKERIRKIKVHTKWNSFVNQEYFECTIALYLGGGIGRTSLVHRLVYQAFIGDIDFETDRLMVMHKDGDGLNNHYSNLVTGSKQDSLKKAYRRKRHISPFALKTKKEFKEISQKSALTRQKRIIQYSPEGNQLRMFRSIKEAAQQTGIPDSNLIRVLKGGALTAGGFVWRYFPGRKKINTEYIRKRKKKNAIQSRRPVQQYSLKGKLLKTFTSISAAANKNSIASSSISNCLAGRTKQSGGYLWKAVRD